MASIHDEEDRIRKELSETYPTNVDTKYRSYPDYHPAEELIVSDGLHYLGDLSHDERCWGRKPGDEEERWKDICEQKRGLVVLTKDLNDAEVWDIRMDHGRDNNTANPTPSRKGFYENLRRWIYGLMTMSDSGEMPEYPTTEDAQKYFEEEPWVRMNLKKEAGKSRVTPTVLRAHVKATKESLKKQLKLYEDASIYLDCAIREGRKLLKELYGDIVPFGDDESPWVYYSEKHRFIVIDSYHPTAWEYGNTRQRVSEEDYYNEMRKAVQAFFKEYFKEHNTNFFEVRKRD